jgi:hypothetical protein
MEKTHASKASVSAVIFLRLSDIIFVLDVFKDH